ncbi:MAG TPA: rhomboid family intramembrane serine protease [Frankiaceae bacterium]|nr:rhomboid family intramembrane serine protease [Frankiaceae bacterium]
MVIPVWDHNPTRRRPYVTYALIALNVVVFLMQPIVRSSVSGDVATAQACRQEAFFQRWGAIPKELLTNDPLDETAGPPAGEDQCYVVERDYDKSPFLSAISAMFLHGGWAHLLGNMLFLFVFGNNVEDRFGRLRFLLAYLVWGVVATYGFAAADADSTAVVIGASGAIAGVLGAYLMMFPRAKVVSLVPILFFFPLRLPAWVVLGLWFLLQWAFSSGATITEGGGVAYLAHVVGFVAGVVAGLFFRGRRVPA